MPKIDLLRLARIKWAVICLLFHLNLCATSYHPDFTPTASITFHGLPPVLQTLECGQTPPAAQVSATSTCAGSVSIKYREWTAHLAGKCTNAYTLYREWTATDQCGNMDVFTARVNFVDNTPPVFINPPPDITGDCVETALAQAPELTDAGGEAFIRQYAEKLVCAPGQITFVRTWIASDYCANTAVYTQHAVVIDTVPPRPMNIPADTTLLPGEAVPPAPTTPGGPWGCDLCGEGPEAPVCFKEESFPDRILRIWQFCDCAGNCVMDTQVIHLATNLPPVFFNLPSGPLNNAGLSCYEFQFIRNQVIALDPPNYDVLPLIISDSVAYDECGDRLLDYVHYTATDTAGATISAVVPISVSEASCFPINYCQTSSQNADNEWINQVVIGNFTQNSGQSPYTDFTTIPVQVAAGGAYALKLTPGYSGPPVPENWTAWLDFNRDGQFDNTLERIDLGSASGPLGTVLHIPVNTLSGGIRLRIAMSPGVPGDACAAPNAGEVEDYLLMVKGLNCLPDNCTPLYNPLTQLWEYISKVKTGNYTHLSGAARYSDFRNQSPITVARGQSYPLQATASSKIASTMNRIWNVYADFNRDGDFSDPQEFVQTISSQLSIANFTLQVPPDAFPGRTTLRIELSRNPLSDACGIKGFGEIEDYALVIQPNAADSTLFRPEVTDRGQAATGVMPGETWSLWPNPAAGSVHLDYNSNMSQVIDFQLFNAVGENVFSKKIEVNEGDNRLQIPFGILPAGIYRAVIGSKTGIQGKMLIISG